MEKRKLNTPFFIVNPKSYIYGDETLRLAKEFDRLAEIYQIDFLFTAQHADLYRIAQETEHLIITAQHIDGHTPGRGMGKILPESIKAAGAQATFLNHAENPLTIEELILAMKRADELGVLTIVCANSVKETQMIATLNPDIMVCEPNELIGTGQASSLEYMKATNEAVRSVNPNVLMLQAAGISTADDVRQALDSGADATGGTSGIIGTENPVATAEMMLQTIAKWKEEQAK